MRRNLDEAVKLIMHHEGGYVNHPSDPGGCTNYGITIATYRKYVNSRGTCSDLKNMQPDVAESIYENTYWSAVEGNKLPDGLDVSVFDMGVNAGPGRAAKILQRLLGVHVDGAIGPITLKAAHDYPNQVELINKYAEARLAYYRSLKIWPTFGRGWTRRTKETQALSVKLSKQPDTEIDDVGEQDEMQFARHTFSYKGEAVAMLVLPADVKVTVEMIDA